MFTSRLPISTSARRPSNHNRDGSTSIPVSVRKANLFTPQTKRSLIPGPSSTARKSFMTTEKKYHTSKPMPDRDEQLKMFDQLVDFLTKYSYNFPLPEAKRFFSSVSSTEVSRLFEFLISRVLPDFKINKLEVDVPEVLTMMEYPYIRSVTKSALVSVTTRQAIVNLLIIYSWLVNFIAVYDSDQEIFKDDPEIPSPARELRRMHRSPEGRASDVLDPTDYDRMFAELSSTNEQIEIEIRKISEELEEINELERKQAEIRDDITKCEQYNTDMNNYIDKLSKADELLEQETSGIIEQIKKSKLELSLAKLPAENMSALQADIKRVREEISTKKLNYERLKQELVDIEFQTTSETSKLESEHLLKKEMYQKVKQSREEELKTKRDKLAAEKAEEDKMVSLIMQNLKATLDGFKQEATIIVNEQRRETEKFQKYRQISQRDNEMVKATLKRIK